MKMRIEGLTDAQCKILDRMWEAETVEELFRFLFNAHRGRISNGINIARNANARDW